MKLILTTKTNLMLGIIAVTAAVLLTATTTTTIPSVMSQRAPVLCGGVP
jgi:hypothetical protein